MKSMEWIMDQVKTLKSLLSYRNNDMINNNNNNKTLALASIETSIETLEELRKAIKNISA